MVRRREPTDGEMALWQEVTRDVERERRRGKAASPRAARSRTVVAVAHGTKTAPGMPVAERPRLRRAAEPPGLDGSTLRRLKSGKAEPQATLDLHGLTQVQAHARLGTFLHRAHEQGLRCVLVVTGKGSPGPATEGWGALPDGRGGGVLRTAVPRWLHEGEIKRHVSGFAEAHVRHGGGGALYVYLRRTGPRG